MPLRRITNFMPQPSPLTSKRYTTSMNGKENTARRTSMTTSTEAYSKPRSRASIVVRPPAPSTAQVLQPRRRVSIATLRPETISEITTPLRTTTSQFASGSSVGVQQSLIRSQRRARYSNLFAPLPELRTTVEMTTPMSIRSSSKFRGSPTQAADSRVARHPAAIALQRKPLVWSPLKLRGLKTNNNRRSLLLPSRPYSELQ